MNTRFSFKSQITWLSTSLILLTVIFLTISNWIRFAAYAEAQIDEQMNIAQNVLNQTLSTQEQVLITTARVLASDFGFKQAVATKDNKTIKSVLINHGKRIDADLMLILDTSGNLQTSNSQYSFSNEVIEKSIRKLPFKNIHAQILSIENKVFQVIVVPVKAPKIIAYTIIGFEFDHDALILFKELISLEVSLVKQEIDNAANTKMRFIDSSIADETIKQQALLDTQKKSPNLLFTHSDYYHKSINFSSSTDVSAILSASLVQIQSDFNQLIFSISMIGLFVIVIAITLSKVLSKGLSTPLNTLMTLTKRISRGELEVPKLNQKLPTEFTDLYQGFVLMSSAIVQREQEIKYQAERDLLTGLYNRYKILNEIQNYINNNIHLLIVTFNIKNFTTVNDTVGFKNADAVLVELAFRTNAFIDTCQNTINNKGFAARINSDEFLVCFPIDNIDLIDLHIEKLRAELEQPFIVSDITLNVCLYYGVSNSIEHGLDAEDLVRRSTMAASAASKNNECIKFYQQGEDEEYLNKLYLIEELKLALDNSDSPLFMNYQPKLNIATGQVDKLEALIRWINKKGNFVNPEVFVGLAEQSGLIVTLTRWVILNVIKQVAQWNTLGHKFQVSINLSAQDIQDPDFVEYLLTTLDNYKVEPHQITLELTERDLAENEALVAARLTHLKSLGFQVSVDDYGIGQSSLAKLKHLPVDELKIDKTFILRLDQSKQDQDIVSSTISLGHKLGLRVVAEGVENKASLDLLQQFKCDYAQGYYLSRPLNAEKLIEWYTRYEQPS